MQAALSPDVEHAVDTLSRAAREAARALAGASTAAKDQALRAAAAGLRHAERPLLEANRRDVARQGGRRHGRVSIA
jgi:glutamate-5-semialdehyde dehydrogenase